MNPRTRRAPAARERLRAPWRQQAAAVVDRYVDPEPTEPLVAFSQPEQRACTLTRELAAFLLEEDRGPDPAA